jgi:acyl-coenzyme A thioesterase PaaI-like protein
MPVAALPFRLRAETLLAQLQQFNERREIRWFGLIGNFELPGEAVLRFENPDSGILGGGGTTAVNGGVIAAAFDGAVILAGLGHYEAQVIVTLELSVKFLNLATNAESLRWRARVVRSSKNFAFAEADLVDHSKPTPRTVAIASAMVAPAS